MKRGRRIALNIVILLAFFASSVIVLVLDSVQLRALFKQDTLPSSTLYQSLLHDLKVEFTYHMQSIEPDDPNDPALKRFPVTWSTSEPWSHPDAPNELVSSVNENLSGYVVHIREQQDGSNYLNHPTQHGIMQDDSGHAAWLLGMRLYVVGDDTVVNGAVMPTEALYDHYLPHWFDAYYANTPEGDRLKQVADRFPLQLKIIPGHSSQDTLHLLEGVDDLVIYDQTIPIESYRKYIITEHAIIPGVGELTIRGPSIVDRMLFETSRRVNSIVYITWMVLFIGLVWLMGIGEKAWQKTGDVESL
ncbi:hypothetical protein BMS3Bbin04_02061 [bacterium BMS3Bbin04]|nr:hypothetical protein BMS3Bbin04_02061 [bacterium BMS3Bbin04]